MILCRMKFQSHWNPLDFMIHICVISLYKDEKGMPFVNFKIINAKNLKMEFKKSAKI